MQNCNALTEMRNVLSAVVELLAEWSRSLVTTVVITIVVMTTLSCERKEKVGRQSRAYSGLVVNHCAVWLCHGRIIRAYRNHETLFLCAHRFGSVT